MSASRLSPIWSVVFLVAGVMTAPAIDVSLPTANHTLLQPGRDVDFFQPTVEGSVESGMFGCFRSGGNRFHEGVDIKCLQRDRRGEATDPVVAVADGEVAFINSKPGLSNYGRYVILKHHWDGVEVYNLYAHLAEVANGLVTGQPVRKGDRVGTLGRSANTREGISRDRAHLHFEINFMLNTNFRIWYPKRDPKAPPFGNFNGQNFVGIDPAAFFRACAENRNLNFKDYIRARPVGFTMLVGLRPFPWLTMHPEQLSTAAAEPVIAYEIFVTPWGLPVAVQPRTAVTETQAKVLRRGLPALDRVNPKELDRIGCRGLVRQRGSVWELTDRGREWADLLTYAP